MKDFDNAPIPADGFSNMMHEARKSLDKIKAESNEIIKAKQKSRGKSEVQVRIPSVTNSPIKHSTTFMS